MDISEFDEDTKLLADINRDGVTDLYAAIEIARIIMEESKAEYQTINRNRLITLTGIGRLFTKSLQLKMMFYIEKSI